MQHGGGHRCQQSLVGCATSAQRHKVVGPLYMRTLRRGNNRNIEEFLKTRKGWNVIEPVSWRMTGSNGLDQFTNLAPALSGSDDCNAQLRCVGRKRGTVVCSKPT